jgi:hypothetical protein
MQGKKQLAVIGAFALMSLTSSVFASMSAPSGWYIEGNVGSTHVSNQKNVSGANTSNSGIGGNADIGYKFMPFVAAEMGYTRYPGTTYTVAGTKMATSTNYSYDLAVRGILPIASSGFELFAKLGAGRVSTKLSYTGSAAQMGLTGGSSSHSATGLYYAVGAQYYFMPELAVNAQWATAYGNNTTGNFSLLSGGVSFIFD